MLKRIIGAVLGIAGLIAPALAQDKAEITVQYAMPSLFKDVMETLAADFMKANPDINVRVLIPADTYGDLLQRTLRSSLSGDMPAVTFQSLAFLRPLVGRDAVQGLDDLAGKDTAFQDRGDEPSIVEMGRVDGVQYGVPFATSTPIIYVNRDLVKKAGGDPENLPTSWDGIIDLASEVGKLPDVDAGIQIAVDQAADWYWQMLVNSFGGSMVDEDAMKVVFDGEAGQQAIDLLERMRDLGQMKMLDSAASRQSFFAGRIGMFIASTGSIAQFERSVGDRFAVDVLGVPLANDSSRLASGGNIAVVHAKDQAEREAAWEFVKFATGPVGTTHQVKMVGYLPTNVAALSDPTLLGGFYDDRPMFGKAAKMATRMVGWYAYPGEEGLKIVDVIRNALLKIYTKEATGADILSSMTASVQALLPKR